ncbi:hypothetical protein DH2020_041358 [Rehmannia glutinosa]|uniref:Reverse transcriptase zinc-binding domain-containing protein n=1 Tax=Rehmannia glutinosa TaxID=99300 RepID=A0ABR0URD1_REHGL
MGNEKYIGLVETDGDTEGNGRFWWFAVFEEFHLAMLGKQMWRLLTQLKSLAARILKAKYYPRTSILMAGLGYQPSYLWRSLLATKPLIERGKGWRLGNGQCIQVQGDKWIGATKSGKLCGTTSNIQPGLKVVNLIDVDRKHWRVEEVYRIFGKDAECIIKMHISPRLPPDRIIWTYSKSGHYTVKSANHVLRRKMSQQLAVPSTSSQNNAWKHLWNLCVPPKIKHFLWRACMNSLPTKTNYGNE